LQFVASIKIRPCLQHIDLHGGTDALILSALYICLAEKKLAFVCSAV
jgi:hypothetical protein